VGIPLKSIIVLLAASAVAAGCAFQRAQIASDAQTSMVGLTKEQTLACMGPPASKAVEGATEVWSFDSGNGMTQYGDGVAVRRFCKVNLTMTGGRINRVDYLGPTGGLLTPGEQCAFALEHCMPR
jgi:hypothetical protein